MNILTKYIWITIAGGYIQHSKDYRQFNIVTSNAHQQFIQFIDLLKRVIFHIEGKSMHELGNPFQDVELFSKF